MIKRRLALRLWLGLGLVCAAVPLQAATARAHPRACTGHGVELQVLGSGGPETGDRRASSSYLVWQDGRAQVLLDSGGGSALRFGQSGARVATLDVILFSHLHIDHSADFPALMKSAYFEDRQQPLPVYGPAGNESFPATSEWLAALFDPRRGAYRYLGDFLNAENSGFKLEAHDVAPPAQGIQPVFSGGGLELAAATMLHGNAPALAWRVRIGGKTLVFSGDTSGINGNLEMLAQHADLLLAHNAVPEGTGGTLLQLHMPPSVIGRIAASARVKSLVLSHRMLRTLGREAETRQAIAAAYPGPVAFADDLDCFH
ncbi:MAG: MBL fold metallo-hydrolase [Nevskia sp.]|nr:MBL fold metallo-hydrolase [Nevskia sp.]